MQLCPCSVREGEESQEISVPREPGAIPVPSTGANLCDGVHLCNSEDGHSARTIAHLPRDQFTIRPGANTQGPAAP